MEDKKFSDMIQEVFKPNEKLEGKERVILDEIHRIINHLDSDINSINQLPKDKALGPLISAELMFIRDEMKSRMEKYKSLYNEVVALRKMNDKRIADLEKKYNEAFEQWKNMLVKENNGRRSKKGTVRLQKRFNMEPDTIAALKKHIGNRSWTVIVEDAIKESLRDKDFSISKYQKSSKEKVGLVVRIDVELDRKLEIKCKELGIRRNIFLENALRQTYRGYFEEA